MAKGVLTSLYTSPGNCVPFSVRCSPVMMAKRRNWETGSRVGGRTELRPGGLFMP